MKKLVFFALFIIFYSNAQTIKEIKIDNKKLIPLIPIKKGDKIKPSLIQSTVVNLYKTGLFYNVKIKVEKRNDGAIVNIQTVPAKYFGKITTKGKIGIKKRRLKKLYNEFYPEGKIFREELLISFIKTLKLKFKELGYPDAEINWTINQKNNMVSPTIEIDCKQPLIVTSIKTNNKKLYKKFIKIREKHVYNKELFLHGIKKLKSYLKQKHYLNSQISFTEKIKGKKVFLTVNIEKGKKFEVMSKDLKIEKEQIPDICAFIKSGEINDTTIKLTEKNLYFKALQSGYYNPEIKIDINKTRLLCEIKKPVKKKIKNIKIESEIPIKLKKTFLFYNKLTKSEIYSIIKEQLSIRGFLKPSIKFKYNEKSEQLIVKVTKGEIYKIGKITLHTDVQLPDNLFKNLIKEGDVFNKEKISETLSTIKSYLIGKGYFDPHIRIKIEKPTKGSIPVYISVNAGEQIFLEDFVIIGNKKIDKNKILKLASFRKGEKVCRFCLDNFKNTLEFSGFFKKVNFDLIKQDENKAVLLIKLKEKRLYSFSYAIGLNSDEGVRLTAKIRKKYFFNSFLTATTIFRTSSKRSQGYFTVSGEKHFLSSLYFTIEDKNNYKFSRYGFSLTYRGEIFSKLKIAESIEFTKNNLTNLTIPQQEIEKELQPDYTFGFRSNLLYDRRDNILFPTKGFFVNANIFPAYVLNDDEFFLKASIKSGIYFKNFEIITNIGNIFTKNYYQVPIPQRFFVGGSTNLRISSFESAGPQFSTGVPKGGHFLFVFTGEYKYHLTDIYYLTFFTDIGNVWEDSSDFSFDSCIKDAGIGLMVKTPIGPIKIQLAKNLDKGTFPSNYKLVFSLGATF